MIRRDHPDLSLSRQCRLLSISRSSLYHTPQGESAENLELMRRIDELFLKYPFYGSRQIDVRGPDLIGALDGKPLEKIGIHPVLGMPCGGPGRLIDGL